MSLNMKQHLSALLYWFAHLCQARQWDRIAARVFRRAVSPTPGSPDLHFALSQQAIIVQDFDGVAVENCCDRATTIGCYSKSGQEKNSNHRQLLACQRIHSGNSRLMFVTCVEAWQRYGVRTLTHYYSLRLGTRRNGPEFRKSCLDQLVEHKQFPHSLFLPRWIFCLIHFCHQPNLLSSCFCHCQ